MNNVGLKKVTDKEQPPSIMVDRLIVAGHLSNLQGCRVQEIETSSRTVNNFDISQGSYDAQELITLMNENLNFIHLEIQRSLSTHRKLLRYTVPSGGKITLKASSELMCILGLIGNKY